MPAGRKYWRLNIPKTADKFIAGNVIEKAEALEQYLKEAAPRPI
jgi:hypothetical protein